MTNTQVTLVQLDNYGPWTVTPAPRREPDLQTLQAELYADLSRLFGSRDGYVFFTRFDNMVAVTNGIDRTAHERIQSSVGNRYPVTVSLSTAAGATPAAALGQATTRLQAAGGAQEADRSEALCWDSAVLDGGDDDLRIAHFDVVDATTRYTDRMGAFPTFVHIERGYVELMEHLYDRHDALAFFVGGDNVIAVCPDIDRTAYEATIAAVRDAVGVDLRVGVGRGATAADAGMAAKHALEDARECEVAVVGDLPAVPGGD